MRRLVLVVLVILALFLAAPAAYAQGGEPVFGGNRVIRNGETHRGGFLVLGGNLRIEQGGTENGSIAVFGGNVDIAGTVRGNISVVGGNVALRSTSVVEGDVSSIGGNIQRAEGSQVRGKSSGAGGRLAPTAPGAPGSPAAPGPVRSGNPLVAFLGWLVRSFFTTLAGTILAILAMLLLPQQMRNVADTIHFQAATSSGVGALTWLAVSVAIPLVLVISGILIVACVGLLGFPLAILLALAFGAAVVFGWLGTGLVVGQRIVRTLGVRDNVPLVAAGLGAVVLTAGALLVQQVPLLGGLLTWLVSLPGLGAVILTWFGTRPWRPGAPFLPRHVGPVGPFGGPRPVPAGGAGLGGTPASMGPTASPWTPAAPGGGLNPVTPPSGTDSRSTPAATSSYSVAGDSGLDTSIWAPPRMAAAESPAAHLDFEPARPSPSDLPRPDFEGPQPATPTGTSGLEAQQVSAAEPPTTVELPRPDYTGHQAGSSTVGEDLEAGQQFGSGHARTSDLPQPDFEAPSGQAHIPFPAMEPSPPPSSQPGQGPIVEPSVSTAPTTASENLQAVPGIGPVYAHLLNVHGVHSYAQLAALTPAQLVEALRAPEVFPVSLADAQAMIEAARRLAGTRQGQ